MLVSILRIETNNGSGPYASDALTYEQKTEIGLHNHCDGYIHPTPYEDGLVETPWDMPFEFSCGFNSLDQLCDWFTDDEISALEEFGFGLVEYMVPEENVMYGNKQVLFRKP